MWKNPEVLTARRAARLGWIARHNHRLYRAYLLKEQLRLVFAHRGDQAHLILPQGADQFVNGATAEAAGVVLTLAPADLTADSVADSVRRLLEDPVVRAAARRVQDEIAGLPTPDDVVAALLADAVPA